MRGIGFAGFAVLLCAMLLYVPVCDAQQYAVPSGSLVVGTGSASSTEYLLNANPAKSQGVLKLDQAGTVGADVTVEVSLKLMPPAFGDAGFVYRTSYWGTTNDTYGWYVGIMKSGVQIGYGTNSSVSSWHRVASVPMKLTPGTWYKLKVVASGDNHKVYLNGQQVIEINNSHFSDVEGYVGLRTFKLSVAYKDVKIE